MSQNGWETWWFLYNSHNFRWWFRNRHYRDIREVETVKMLMGLPLLYMCQGQEVGHRSSFYFFWSCCWYIRIKPPWLAVFHCIYLLPSWELPLVEIVTALFICTTKPHFAAVRLRKNGSKSLSELIIQCGLPDLNFNNHNILACRIVHIS